MLYVKIIILFEGAIIIVNALASNESGLKHICLSKCGITGKAANSLGIMLCENMNNLETLTHLDLSYNNLKDDIHVNFLFKYCIFICEIVYFTFYFISGFV